MLRKLLIYFLVSCLPIIAWGQFAQQGSIVYDRKLKLKRAIEWEPRFERLRRFADRLPQDLHAHFKMQFNNDKSDYYFLEDTSGNKKGGWLTDMMSNNGIANKNQVISNFKAGTRESIKKVFEKTFFIKDSIIDFKWKVEDQVRMIAGYPCRKAITTICDSVVVVAFYSDQIQISGGPEGFNGLPGMILGLAIPRLYTTWFATKVTTTPPKFKKPDIPKKAVETNRKEFFKEIEKDTKNSRWLKSDRLIWQVTL